MTKLYVRNLEPNATEQSVRLLFETYGDVKSIRVSARRKAARPDPFAFVEMGDVAAMHAIEALHGRRSGAESLHVIRARPARPASREAAD